MVCLLGGVEIAEENFISFFEEHVRRLYIAVDDIVAV